MHANKGDSANTNVMTFAKTRQTQRQICPDDGDGVENYNCVQTFFEAVGNVSSAKTTHSEGVPNVLSNSSAGFADAVATAEAADQVLLFLGIDGTVEGEGKDRHSIGLPDGQMALAKAVIAACATTNKPVAVVLVNGGQLAVDWLAEHSPAIVEAWYPGIYGAASVANAVYGKSNRWGTFLLLELSPSLRSNPDEYGSSSEYV